MPRLSPARGKQKGAGPKAPPPRGSRTAGRHVQRIPKLRRPRPGAPAQGSTVDPDVNILAVIMDKAEQEENPLILILDGLNDPHNFGSILRTADATQVTGVIIPKHRAVGVTPVVAKTSTGAVEHIPIARVTNLSQTLDKLKEAGFWVFGTDMDGTASHKWNTAGKLALIIGNEGKGISANIKKQVDEMITIPMGGHVQSLNASVAAAVLMYEVYRNRL